MKKFIEAKEAKGYSYRDIADGIGMNNTKAQRSAIANVFVGKRYASMERLTKIGKFLGLKKDEIETAFLEQKIVWIENGIERRKNGIERRKNELETVKKQITEKAKPKKPKK